MLETTIAGSLPKPSWLAEPKKLWPAWRLDGDALAEGKRDATILALKVQEDCGIDIVSDGEQSRQHFVHGFLEGVAGIDFARRVPMGIRNNRYEAMVPTVTGPLRRKGPVHAAGVVRGSGSPGLCPVRTIVELYRSGKPRTLGRRPPFQNSSDPQPRRSLRA